MFNLKNYIAESLQSSIMSKILNEPTGAFRVYLNNYYNNFKSLHGIDIYDYDITDNNFVFMYKKLLQLSDEVNAGIKPKSHFEKMYQIYISNFKIYKKVIWSILNKPNTDFLRNNLDIKDIFNTSDDNFAIYSKSDLKKLKTDLTNLYNSATIFFFSGEERKDGEYDVPKDALLAVSHYGNGNGRVSYTYDRDMKKILKELDIIKNTNFKKSMQLKVSNAAYNVPYFDFSELDLNYPSLAARVLYKTSLNEPYICINNLQTKYFLRDVQHYSDNHKIGSIFSEKSAFVQNSGWGNSKKDYAIVYIPDVSLPTNYDKSGVGADSMLSDYEENIANRKDVGNIVTSSLHAANRSSYNPRNNAYYNLDAKKDQYSYDRTERAKNAKPQRITKFKKRIYTDGELEIAPIIKGNTTKFDSDFGKHVSLTNRPDSRYFSFYDQMARNAFKKRLELFKEYSAIFKLSKNALSSIEKTEKDFIDCMAKAVECKKDFINNALAIIEDTDIAYKIQNEFNSVEIGIKSIMSFLSNIQHYLVYVQKVAYYKNNGYDSFDEEKLKLYDDLLKNEENLHDIIVSVRRNYNKIDNILKYLKEFISTYGNFSSSGYKSKFEINPDIKKTAQV